MSEFYAALKDIAHFSPFANFLGKAATQRKLAHMITVFSQMARKQVSRSCNALELRISKSSQSSLQ
jgi:hypothetical protein